MHDKVIGHYPVSYTHLDVYKRQSLSFSKSVELHDKVIGHYLNIKHYQ
ncbi:IS1 family transposase [Escherichia coli]|nr:IS1 family transposase [Escherichia coli]